MKLGYRAPSEAVGAQERCVEMGDVSANVIRSDGPGDRIVNPPSGMRCIVDYCLRLEEDEAFRYFGVRACLLFANTVVAGYNTLALLLCICVNLELLTQQP